MLENTPFTVDVFVEIPKGSRNKYEYDHEHHVFRLDRMSFSAVQVIPAAQKRYHK